MSLSYGMSITAFNDPLKRTSIEVVSNKIKNPRPDFAAKIEHLRLVRQLDPKQYQKMKSTLPYFCSAIFNPLIRRKEYFAAISTFTIDLDNFSTNNIKRKEVFERLKADPHIALLFTTPSGDGLKALYTLSEPCKDAGLYSHFYKAFLKTFANKYELEKVVDWTTHDVARASFFSADQDAWINKGAVAVELSDYVKEELGLEFSIIEKEFNSLWKEHQNSNENKKENQALSSDTLNQIKLKLNPNYKSKRDKPEAFVPLHLEESLPRIEAALNKEGIIIERAKSINYGKQLHLRMDHLWGELNVFYGQRGFSVIRTSKTGSNSNLVELGYQIVDSLLNG